MNNAQLVSFWDGPVTWVERLCAASMLQHGNPLAIYTYDPEALTKLNLGGEIRDARDVTPESHPVQRYRAGRRYAMFANLFRLYLQRESKGIWVDLDCYMLKPFAAKSDYVFGYASPGKLNNAVLRLPADCPMIEEYISAVTADPLRTPWSTLRRRVARDVEILLGRSQPRMEVRTNIGPRALTYFAKRHGVISHAKPKEAFYAIANRETNQMFLPDDTVSDRLSPGADLLHLWRGRIKRLGHLAELPPATSYLGKACKQYGITAAA